MNQGERRGSLKSSYIQQKTSKTDFLKKQMQKKPWEYF
jgi:hypothetical protein